MKFPPLHENPLISLILWIIAMSLFWVPLANYLKSIMFWVQGLFDPDSFWQQALAAELGAILAFLLFIAGLFCLIFLAGKVQDVIKARNSDDDENQ